MEVEEVQRVSLVDLPAECIIHALSFLESPKDILGFEATCRQFWALGRLAETWAPRLKQRFGLSLKVRAGLPSEILVHSRGKCRRLVEGFDTLAKTSEGMFAERVTRRAYIHPGEPLGPLTQRIHFLSAVLWSSSPSVEVSIDDRDVGKTLKYSSDIDLTGFSTTALYAVK